MDTNYRAKLITNNKETKTFSSQDEEIKYLAKKYGSISMICDIYKFLNSFFDTNNCAINYDIDNVKTIINSYLKKSNDEFVKVRNILGYISDDNAQIGLFDFITLDEINPIFTSDTTFSVNENQTSAFTAIATDNSTVTYSISGTDASSFSIDSTTGVVTFNSAPDYETKNSYYLEVIAIDTSNNSSTQNVTINIIDEIENVVEENDVNNTSVVFKTGQTTSYITGDDGYYASTLGIARSFTRDNSKEIVTDNIIKLQWQDDSTAATTITDWTTATTSTCQNLTLGGYSDWRLPTIEELESIVNYGTSNPKYSEFLNFASGGYWSSSTFAYVLSSAWVVSFNYGRDGWNDKTDSLYVRCVRAGE